MPIKPEIQELNANSAQILNAVRNDIGGVYASQVPVAEPTTASIRSIGEIINTYQPLQNAFLSALVNRIGRVVITSRLYENPWAMFKKGLLEYGETVEEIFVNLAKPHEFDPELAETNQFKREIPDVRAAFHTMNYQKFYKVTVSNDQLRQAFLSWEGISDLIGRIIDTLYTGANYDEFLTMKYLIARMALNGNIYPMNIPAVNADNAKTITASIKGIANQLQFMSSEYNIAGVKTYTDPRDLVLIMNARFDAVMDVEVLAAAFNLPYVDFLNRRVLIDSFGTLDNDRLAELFANDPNYVPMTQEQLNQLDTIPAFMCDESWFMIFDNFYNMTEKYNGEGLYWNYWYHVWKTFSASPFSNAILFTTETPAVSAVAVSPATATVGKGTTLQLAANVTATGFADTSVTWSLAGATTSTITPAGLLSVPTTETAATITVTATSNFDGTKSGTSTITVPAGA